MKYDVGSSHPGAEEGPKGLAVRQLKRYASWVQTVVRQVGLYPVWAFGFLKGFVSSKQLLLFEEIRIDNSANNGEVLLTLGLLRFYSKSS